MNENNFERITNYNSSTTAKSFFFFSMNMRKKFLEK